MAAAHVEELQRAILDHENIDALRESVKTLANTLKSIEVAAKCIFCFFIVFLENGERCHGFYVGPESHVEFETIDRSYESNDGRLIRES